MNDTKLLDCCFLILAAVPLAKMAVPSLMQAVAIQGGWFWMRTSVKPWRIFHCHVVASSLTSVFFILFLFRELKESAECHLSSRHITHKKIKVVVDSHTIMEAIRSDALSVDLKSSHGSLLHFALSFISYSRINEPITYNVWMCHQCLDKGEMLLIQRTFRGNMLFAAHFYGFILPCNTPIYTDITNFLVGISNYPSDSDKYISLFFLLLVSCYWYFLVMKAGSLKLHILTTKLLKHGQDGITIAGC